MNKVQHLWNLVNQLSSNSAVEATALQSHYVERCRRMEEVVELPKRIFGPGEMCSYCGHIWSNNIVDHRVRIKRGKRLGKSVGKLLKKINMNNEKKMKVGNIEDSLLKKSIKNIDNKIIIRCFICRKDTIIKLKKPKRLKAKFNDDEDNQVGNEKNDSSIVVKRRKKRTKDKTAGLIIVSSKLSKNESCKDLSKSKCKIKNTNLNKLGAMIKKNLTPSKKSSLHDFITDLEQIK